MSEYFDTLETREPAARESQLMQALPQLLEHALSLIHISEPTRPY